jgi:hypothetical protein
MTRSASGNYLTGRGLAQPASTSRWKTGDSLAHVEGEQDEREMAAARPADVDSWLRIPGTTTSPVRGGARASRPRGRGATRVREDAHLREPPRPHAEEIGPSGELLGNFPQAFMHLSLISTPRTSTARTAMPPHRRSASSTSVADAVEMESLRTSATANPSA